MTYVSVVLADMCARGIIGKYAVGGASAVAFYAEPIATKDLDIFFFLNRRRTDLYFHWGRSTIIAVKWLWIRS